LRKPFVTDDRRGPALPPRPCADVDCCQPSAARVLPAAMGNAQTANALEQSDARGRRAAHAIRLTILTLDDDAHDAIGVLLLNVDASGQEVADVQEQRVKALARHDRREQQRLEMFDGFNAGRTGDRLHGAILLQLPNLPRSVGRYGET